MKYNFKYFYDTSGVAPENEINKWLNNNDIKIHHTFGDGDRVYIFYEDLKKLSPKGKGVKKD